MEKSIFLKKKGDPKEDLDVNVAIYGIFMPPSKQQFISEMTLT